MNGFFKENYDIDQLEGIINIEKGELSYYIKPNSDATRCFVSFVAKGHIRIISKAIEDVNYKLKSSKFRKYFYILKAYDGLSKYYCEILAVVKVLEFCSIIKKYFRSYNSNI